MNRSVFAIALLGLASPLQAQSIEELFAEPTTSLYASRATATKSGFVFPSEPQNRKIVIISPDIFVGEQSTGGLDRLNADWTEDARKSLLGETGRQLRSSGFEVTMLPDVDGEDGKLLVEYRALFKLVSSAAIRNDLFPTDPLPTKKNAFDWSMGEGVSKLSELGGDARYGLFLYSYDSYGLPGRKAMEVIGLAAGLDATAPPHIGYAGLVDLQNGDLVWLNVNVRLGGDIRRPDGVKTRAERLLKKFPAFSVRPK